MLDALKGIGGGNKADREDLQKLVDRVREERSALSAMLTQVAMRSAKLGEHGKVLEQTDKKVVHADGRLDELLKRVDGFAAKT